MMSCVWITCSPERLTNISHLAGNPRFRFVQHDVTDYIFVDGELDAILHFASPASPADYLNYPIQTLKVGSLGTHKALGLAKEKRARFLLASTSEVYGDPLLHPQTEEYWGNVNCIGLRSCYDEGKRLAETLMMDYHRQSGVDIRIARIFNTYGPRMRPNDGRVVSNFIVQALSDQPLTIYGTGQQTRSFCFVEDEIRGLVQLLLAPPTEDIHQPVNIGNPQELTIQEIAQAILTLTSSGSILKYEPLPEDDPKVRQALSMAVNVPAIVEKLLRRRCKVKRPPPPTRRASRYQCASGLRDQATIKMI
jgi:dTDP-glucose 4,6-dehydratase